MVDLPRFASLRSCRRMAFRTSVRPGTGGRTAWRFRDESWWFEWEEPWNFHWDLMGFMVINGLSLGLNGNSWELMVINGNSWWFNGISWEFHWDWLGFNGIEWELLKMNGNSWEFLWTFIGNSWWFHWDFMGIHWDSMGILWDLMVISWDFHGNFFVRFRKSHGKKIMGNIHGKIYRLKLLGLRDVSRWN